MSGVIMASKPVNRNGRKVIAEETLEVISNGSYVNAHNATIDFKPLLDRSLDGTKVWTPEELDDLVNNQTGTGDIKTRFHVTDESTLSAAYRIVVEEKQTGKVCALNFGSGKNPGGGFLKGSQAQEETLNRSSALYECLLKKGCAYYSANWEARAPFYTHSMIWSPDVPVFRNDITNEFLDNTYQLNIITAPAVNAGWAYKSGKGTPEEIQSLQRERIARLLGLAIHQGVTTLILGAWGCGCFGHKAPDMAAHFKYHLGENGAFKDCFDEVVFAVHYTSNPDNVAAFEKEFSQLQSVDE